MLVTGWGTPALPDRFVELDDLPLRYVCHLAGSVRAVTPPRLIERGVLVSNWGAAISHTVAEHAVLLILGALRNLPGWQAHLRRPPPERFTYGSELRTLSLRGRRVGLHGFGAIARELAVMLRGFGVRIAAFSEGVPASLFAEHGVEMRTDLQSLFATSDVLVECEALNARTRGSVTASLLRSLPANAVFVNVARGAIVDETALFALAAQGHLRIAADVFQQEPLPSDSPLLDVPNALLSPHIAGPTSDTYRLCGDFALANVERFLAGQAVEGAVDMESYLRST